MNLLILYLFIKTHIYKVYIFNFKNEIKMLIYVINILLSINYL